MGRPKKNKVYLAGPWFDEKAKVIHDVAKDIIRNINGVDYFFPDEQSCSDPSQTFYSNVKNIVDCTYLVALVDVKDVGTAWEIGMAYQLKKRIILVGINEASFLSKTNLMLAYTTGMCITIGNLEKLLKGEPYHSACLSRKWEDIE